MDARWMPLLAAAVGVLGGVGGAYIGGVVANEGQEKQSESERAAAIQDLRVDAYGDYLGSAEALVGALSVDSSRAERNAAVEKLFAAGARVLLIAEHPAVLEKRLHAITEAVDKQDANAYIEAAKDFRAVARAEIEETAY